MTETEPKIMTTKLQPGELEKFREMGLGDAKFQSQAERDLYAFQNGGDPVRLKLVTDTSPAASRSDQAAKDAADAHYRKLQTEARAAEQKRADAALPQYTEDQVAAAATKIEAIRLGLTDEAVRFRAILFNPAHVGHRKVSEEWSAWHKVANAAKR